MPRINTFIREEAPEAHWSTLLSLSVKLLLEPQFLGFDQIHCWRNRNSYLPLGNNPPTIKTIQLSPSNITIKKLAREDLQDGGGVRRGDQLPPHKYIRNTSTCGTTPTEHPLNMGRRPQTSQKTRNSPSYLGRAKEKRRKEGQKNWNRTCTTGRELWRRKGFHTLGSPFTTERRGGQEGSFRATEESAATWMQRAKRRDSRTEDRCRPALTSPGGLSAHPTGRAGAGSWG